MLVLRNWHNGYTTTTDTDTTIVNIQDLLRPFTTQSPFPKKQHKGKTLTAYMSLYLTTLQNKTE